MRTLCGTILAAVAGWTAWGAQSLSLAAETGVCTFNAVDYTALRRELRAFYPDECHDKSIHTLLVSANGTEPGMYRNEINSEVTLDALYASEMIWVLQK